MRVSFGQEQEVDLQLEINKSKSIKQPGFEPLTLEKRFSLAKPQVFSVTATELNGDPDAANFVRSDNNSAYHLVTLSCTFYPSEHAPFKEAWVRILLEGKQETLESPIAVSMKPMHETDLVESSGKIAIKLGAKLPNEIEPTIGFELGSKGQHQQSFITAFGLQQSDPYWHFRSTAERELEGSYQMALLIKRDKTQETVGTLSAIATVQRKKALIFSYKTSIEAQSLFTFVLP